MKANNEDSAGLTNGDLLGILTVLYVFSAYFILHTTWLYNNPNSYLSKHYGHYILLNDVAYLFLFLPFGISTYYYQLQRNRFQSPIGTNKTSYYLYYLDAVYVFQSPIGTNKTPKWKSCEIP